MLLSFRHNVGLVFMLMDKAGEGGGGGSGGGSGEGKGGAGAGSGGNSGGGNSGNADLSAVLSRLDKLEKENAELKKAAGGSGSGGGGQDDPTLAEKARKEAEEKAKKDKDTKHLESALKFTMGSKEWIKANATLLPKNIEGIFAAAEKETYDSAIQKASDIQASIIQEFFNQQANLDLLTDSQKVAIADFQKLTKNGRQEKAQQIYDAIFEPTFEMLKRIKKAEQLQAGQKDQTDGEKALADRMMKLSKKHYLGEKFDA